MSKAQINSQSAPAVKDWKRSRFVGGVHDRPTDFLFPTGWAVEAGARAYLAVLELAERSKSKIAIKRVGAKKLQRLLTNIAMQYELDKEWHHRIPWSDHVKSLDNVKAAAEKLLRESDKLRPHARGSISKYMLPRDGLSTQNLLAEFLTNLKELPEAVKKAQDRNSYYRNDLDEEGKSPVGRNQNIHLHEVIEKLADLWVLISKTPIVKNMAQCRRRC